MAIISSYSMEMLILWCVFQLKVPTDSLLAVILQLSLVKNRLDKITFLN